MKNLIHISLILILVFPALSFGKIETDPEKLEAYKAQLQRRSAGLVSDSFNRRMERVAREMGREDFDRAIELLESLIESSRGNRYEHAMALQNLGFAYIQNENVSRGLEVIEEALALDALPFGPTLNLTFVLAQVLLAEGRHQDSLAYFKQWFVLTNDVNANAYILKGAVYAEMEEYARALELVETGLGMTDEPQEAWLSFAAGLYYQNERYSDSARLFRRLAESKPEEKRYWTQLSGIFATMEEDNMSLASMQMNEKMELLSEQSDYFNLCSLYNYVQIPINCARLMERALEIEDLIEDQVRAKELLFRAYIMAREPKKAVAPLADLAEKTGLGKYLQEIGMIHYTAHEWEKAIDYLNQALAKDDLEDRQKGNTLLSKGISFYQLGEYRKSMEAFNQLEQFESHKDHASAWIGQVRQQLQ